MPAVICIGELLVDMVAGEADVSLAQARTFHKAPGGAPANVAVGVVRLGQSAGFIGAVGSDPFGEFLHDVMTGAGVDASHLARIDNARTSLAFIASRSDAGKDIAFWRNPGADMMLAPRHISKAYVEQAKALHFGSISRIDESPRQATDRAYRLAASAGAMISYDPNWRPSLWSDHELARRRILEGMYFAHVVKVSSEEWQFITGGSDFAPGAQKLLECGPQLVVRSEGAGGASFATTRCSGHVEPFAVKCVEPTGAGDGFMACLIVELLEYWTCGMAPGHLDQQELTRIIRRANATGALACTKVGAIPSLPTAAEVDAFIAAAK